MSTIRVAIFAFDGINLFHLSIPSTVICADKDHDTIHYNLKYFSLNPGKFCSEQKVEITVDNGLEILKAADIIIIPAWHNPQEKAPEELAAALQQAHQRGSLIVGLCLGAFVLGDAGLLDGREATTHWASRETFVERFPASIFRPDVLYITDDNIITSAGTVAAIDCCLDLLRQRHGSEVANHTARLLVTPPHRSGGQAQYIERPLPKLTNDERIPDVMNWAPKNLQQPLSLDILAKKSNMSRRTFTRRFRETTGSTVTQWLNTERVCRAQQLLETTNLSIERISSEAGFSSALPMRQQFSKQLGTTPSAYRQKFYKQPDWPESI